MEIKELARIVDTAAHLGQPITQLSQNHHFSEADAYAIQAASLQRRYDRGEQLIGLKMGFTSKAKMEQMGVNDLIWGRLTDAMLLANGGSLSLDRFIHPRAEPEICFLVNQPIDRELSLEETPNYVSAVAPALEIIDSRYENFKFSLEDVIADNCSSAALVLGEWQLVPSSLDQLAISLEIDGQIVHLGSSSAILGNPWASFQAATRLAAHYGQVIAKGAYIMAGAATPAVYLERGQSVAANVERLGGVILGVQ
ncbi:MAG: fumarylacetoacetate hydrolase family protein [Bacteroidota bacterium]